MVYINFYFQVHQPYRIRDYTIFDINKNHDYFDTKKNVEIIKKVSRKSYLPMNKLLEKHLHTYDEFKFTFSFSGVVLEQFEKYVPETLESFQKLVDNDNVELLGETYYHSLSFLFSEREFKEQVQMHKKRVYEIFGKIPKVFRNTELIYNNRLAFLVKDLGFKGAITEGADHILGWRSPNYLYKAKGSDLPLLLKNYKLSDDIAFRFSDRNWNQWPLTVEKYVSWINNVEGYFVNLFMDYETFGEHQWKESGIFEFMKYLPKELLKHKHGFITPSEAIERFEPVDEVDIPHTISWADTERDLSAWNSNSMQSAALKYIYMLEKKVKKIKDSEILEDWRKLQISDHFYYMCTKYFNDGDVHKYFNPYESPYEAFIYYMNCLQDLKKRIEVKERMMIKNRLKKKLKRKLKVIANEER